MGGKCLRRHPSVSLTTPAPQDFYAHKIASLRGRELQAVRKISMALAVMVGSMTFIPTLAAILSFVTYALSGHALDVPTIFTAFQFFEIIRQPLTVFPFVLVSLAEARVAAARIAAFLGAEERQAPHAVDRASASAVAIDAEFAWEAAANAEGKAEEEKKPAPPSRRQFGRKAKRSEEPVLPTAQPEGEAAGETAQRPFELKDVRLTVRKGDFVAIIGRIGSGKSSLLQR
jgi:ATP-binding cassette subfamily C (CFTR/MRP) protein 1